MVKQRVVQRPARPGILTGPGKRVTPSRTKSYGRRSTGVAVVVVPESEGLDNHEKLPDLANSGRSTQVFCNCPG